MKNLEQWLGQRLNSQHKRSFGLLPDKTKSSISTPRNFGGSAKNHSIIVVQRSLGIAIVATRMI
jgi:hypothetical protein